MYYIGLVIRRITVDDIQKTKVMLSHPHSTSTNTSASASVSVPLALVFRTSLILLLLDTRTLLGASTRGPLMFSQVVRTKCASTSGERKSPTARAAPRTVATPQSLFISFIMAVLMVYPLVSKISPFPTIPACFLLVCNMCTLKKFEKAV